MLYFNWPKRKNGTVNQIIIEVSRTKPEIFMKTKLQSLFIALALFAAVDHTIAQGTAFTYQGRLNSGGAPASGSYDLTFSLFSTNASGVAIAGPVTNSATAVTNGLFTTTIDFGAGVFTGTSNWLEIAVRTNGGASKSRPRRMPFIQPMQAPCLMARSIPRNWRQARWVRARFNTPPSAHHSLLPDRW